MRPLEMQSTGPKIDDARIRKLEESIGCKLPSSYCEFLLKYNGGAPSDSNAIFMYRPENGASTIVVGVDLFLAVENPEDPCCTLEYWLNLPMDDQALDGLLHIADAAMGDEICLGITKDNYGKMFYFDHEHHAFETGLYQIANSFDEFVNGLEAFTE